MTDRAVSFGCVVAYLMWFAVAVLLTLGWVLHLDELAYYGLATSAAAATAHIRLFFCRYSKALVNAFDAGRDHERQALRTV